MSNGPTGRSPTVGRAPPPSVQQDAADGDGDGETETEPDGTDGIGTSPPAGTTPPGGRDGTDEPSEPDTDQPDGDGGLGTSPPAGTTPPGGRGDTEQPDAPAPEPPTDQPPTSDALRDNPVLRQQQREVASQSEAIDPSDVRFGRSEARGVYPTVPESTLRQNLRQDVAGESEALDPGDVTVEESDGEFRAFVPEATAEAAQETQIAEETAAQYEGVEASDLAVERTETGIGTSPAAGEAPPGDVAPDAISIAPTTDEARLAIAAEQSRFEQDALSIEGGEVVVDQGATEGAGEDVEIWTPPSVDEPSADAELATEVATGGQRTERSPDATGPTPGAFGIAESLTLGQLEAGFESLETETSEEVGIDIGETTGRTADILTDRPVESFTTGVTTIRTGAAATAEDVAEDTTALGAVAGATGTGTGTATGTVASLGATGASATLPAAAAIFGVRGVQERGVTLPTPETAPSPGEGIEEIEPTREQFPSEVPAEGQAMGQPEVTVGTDTDVTTTTEVPADQGAFAGEEIAVPGEAATGTGVTELPVGGTEGTETAERAATDQSVVPGDYPQAGRDFPADPTREYVPGQRPAPETRAAQQVIGGTIGETQERTERREITEEDIADPDELEEQRRRDFREQFERFQEDVRDGSGRGFEDAGQFVFPAEPSPEFTGDVTDPELTTAQRPALQAEAQLSAPTQLPDVLAGIDTATAQETGQATEQTVEVDALQAQATDVAAEQAFITPQPTATPPGFGFPTEFGYPTGYGFGEGPPGETQPPTVPTLPRTDDDRDEDRPRLPGEAAEERIAGFADPLSGEF